MHDGASSEKKGSQTESHADVIIWYPKKGRCDCFVLALSLYPHRRSGGCFIAGDGWKILKSSASWLYVDSRRYSCYIKYHIWYFVKYHIWYFVDLVHGANDTRCLVVVLVGLDAPSFRYHRRDGALREEGVLFEALISYSCRVSRACLCCPCFLFRSPPLCPTSARRTKRSWTLGSWPRLLPSPCWRRTSMPSFPSRRATGRMKCSSKLAEKCQLYLGLQ